MPSFLHRRAAGRFSSGDPHMQTSFPYGSAFLLLRTDAKLISWSRSFFPLRCKSLKKTAAEAASTSALGKGWREHAAASGFLDHYTAASDNVHATWTYRNKKVSYGNNLDKQERINFCIFFFLQILCSTVLKIFLYFVVSFLCQMKADNCVSLRWWLCFWMESWNTYISEIQCNHSVYRIVDQGPIMAAFESISGVLCRLSFLFWRQLNWFSLWSIKYVGYDRRRMWNV